MFVFFNDTATTEIYTLSLHDALPISRVAAPVEVALGVPQIVEESVRHVEIVGEDKRGRAEQPGGGVQRSEEHTSELQSRQYLVCRLLLEKKTRGRLWRSR